MNRKQYLILCTMRRRAREAEKRERTLRKINEDPHQQYDWDAWMRAEGFASGIMTGLISLEAFIAAGRDLTAAGRGHRKTCFICGAARFRSYKSLRDHMDKSCDGLFSKEK